MMKRALVAIGAVMFVAGAARAAQADDIVVAKVPFAFVVNGIALPAGDYVVSRDTRNPELVSISTANGDRVALVLSMAADTARTAQPKLEFERVGKQMYLSQVTLGPGSAREIPVAVAAEAVDAPRR